MSIIQYNTAELKDEVPPPVRIDQIGLARLELQARNDAITRLTDEHCQAFRWLTASLFALNAGGILKVFNDPSVSARPEMWACICFLLGIVFALLAAWWNQSVMGRTIQALAEGRNYWAAVAHGVPYNEEVDNELNRKVQASNRFNPLVSVAGWFSALAFLTGVVIVGLSEFS